MIFSIPAEFNGRNKGEKRVFDSLKNLFPGKKNFSVHSVGLSNHLEKRQGECDFILITDLGIFCLEVKSGPVKRSLGLNDKNVENEGGLWIYSTYQKKESPFKQAGDAVYPIEEKLSNADKTRRNKFVIGRGVIFTDIEFSDESIEWDLNEVCSQSQLRENFELYIKNLSKFHKKRLLETKGIKVNKNPNYDDLVWALKTLIPEISHTSLIELENSKDEIIRLEETQKAYVDQLILRKRKQSIIDGVPGSGKTLIIQECIHSLSTTEKILLTCYNSQLKDYLAQKFKSKENVTVLHYHALMEYYCNMAGLPIPSSEEKTLNYFNEALPKNFENALLLLFDKKKLDLFDWIFVDEGQDILNESSFNNLTELLTGGKKNGNFLISIDSGVQKGVYKNLNLYFLENLRDIYHHLPLKRNFRNPKTISNRAASIVGVERPLTKREFVSAPQGELINENSSHEIISKLNYVVSKLIKKGVKPNEISILTLKNRKKSILSSLKTIAGEELIDMKINHLWTTSSSNGIGWSTVSSFKGLENEYIILIESDYDRYDDWLRSLLYVAMTRVKFRFIYIGVKNGKVINSIFNNRFLND